MAGLWLLVASQNLRADSRVREGTSGDLTVGALGSAGKSQDEGLMKSKHEDRLGREARRFLLEF